MRKQLSILSIAVGGTLLLWWAIRAHDANLAFAATMPGQQRAEVKSFQVFREDFFNVQFELPIPPPPARPKLADLIACDFTLRILADSGRVIDSRSVTSLASDPFPYPASSLETFYIGYPIFLFAGVYRVEIDNRADTPAFRARGAELRLEPHRTVKRAVFTQVLLLSGVVFVALGLLIGRPLLNRSRDAA